MRYFVSCSSWSCVCCSSSCFSRAAWAAAASSCAADLLRADLDLAARYLPLRCDMVEHRFELVELLLVAAPQLLGLSVVVVREPRLELRTGCRHRRCHVGDVSLRALLRHAMRVGCAHSHGLQLNNLRLELNIMLPQKFRELLLVWKLLSR